mgnify:CR=1 FL=1
MNISITYKRVNLFDNFEYVTDSIDLTSIKNVDKYVDAVFGKLANDSVAYIDIMGLKFFWNNDEDYTNDLVTIYINDKTTKMSRTHAIFNIKKLIHRKLKDGGYDIVFE